jgi:monoamine oxidase
MSEINSELLDVIVVGAGVSGLAAAQALKQAGKRIVVLEARDRIGGRIFTRRDIAEIPVELGGELVSGTQAATWPLIREHGIRTVELAPANASERLRLDFSKLPKPHAHEDVAEYLARINMGGKHMPPYLQFLSMDDEPFRRMEARFFFAYYSHQSASGELYGEHDFRVPDGYDQVPHVLAKGVPLRLKAVVQEIEWSETQAKVLFLHNHKIEAVQAKTVLLTLPIGILRHGDVHFSPALPPSKIAAIQNFSTVDVAKMIYTFDHPVLPDDIDQLHDFKSNPPMWWRGSAGHNDYDGDVIVAWTAGDNARTLLEQDYETALFTGLQSLRKLLDNDDLMPTKAIMHNWAGDPYTRGAYSFSLTGSDEAHDILGRPVGNTLFWAGEATNAKHQSTVHGAYESGLRAAEQILQNL